MTNENTRIGEAMEEWRTVVIDGEVYENYEISNMGRIRSLNYNGERGRIKVLKARDNGTGYLNVVLYKNKKPKRFYVHRLVALMFIENDDPTVKVFVNHIDKNTHNNSVKNLEWCDRQYNNEYSLAIKVRCVETGQTFMSASEAGRKTGLQASKITGCCKGRKSCKTCGGYHWEYVD